MTSAPNGHTCRKRTTILHLRCPRQRGSIYATSLAAAHTGTRTYLTTPPTHGQGRECAVSFTEREPLADKSPRADSCYLEQLLKLCVSHTCTLYIVLYMNPWKSINTSARPFDLRPQRTCSYSRDLQQARWRLARPGVLSTPSEITSERLQVWTTEETMPRCLFVLVRLHPCCRLSYRPVT